MDARSEAFNAALAAEIGLLGADPNITIHDLDVAGLFAEVNSDPAAFGLTNLVDPALSVELSSGIPLFPFDVVDNPDEYLWWDGVHPTAAAHQIIGNRAASLVRPVPEPTSVASWSFVLAGCLLARRRRSRER